jgi:hypothetical protein
MQIISLGFAMNLTSKHRKSFYSNKFYLLYFCLILFLTICLFTAFSNDNQNIFGSFVLIDEISRIDEDTDTIVYDYDDIKNEKNRTYLFVFVFMNFIITVGIEKFFNYIFREESILSQNNYDFEIEDE